MATKTSQRVFIWVIAIVMTVGTIAGFVAMIIAPANEQKDQEQQEKLIAEYQEQVKEAEEERQKSLRPLMGYAAKPFDADKVSELKTEVLKKGNGEPLKEDSALKVNYFGWTADGKIFDSTNIDGKTTPTTDLSLNGVIPGWTKGLVGKKVGSTVMLMIPTDLAYGESAAEMGRPVGPLYFIIEILPTKK